MILFTWEVMIMAIYKNKKGLYSIKGKYKALDGTFKNYHRFKGDKGFKKKAEALQADMKLRDELTALGQSSVGHQHTFKTLSDEYFVEKKRTLKYSSIYSEMKIIKRASTLEDILIKAVQPKHIQIIIDQMNEENLSVNYIKRFTDTVSKIFEYAVKKEYLARNPVKKVVRIKRPHEVVKKKMNFWEPEEYAAFIKHVDNPLYKAYFEFSYFMGCRRGEIIALQWKDINFKTGIVDIYKTCNQTPENDEKYILTSPKTKNSTRSIKMPSNLLKTMQELKKVRANMYYYNEDWFVFGADTPLAETTLQRYFNLYLDKGNYIGYKRITLHGFRHSHVSFLINKGANVKAIADRVGDTVDQVLKTYSHLFQKTEDELIAIIDESTF